MVELDENIKLDKQKKHTIELVVDRIKISSDARKRIAESVETAIENACGIILVIKGGEVLPDSETKSPDTEHFFSQKNACPDCGISIPELQPRLFSFNNPFGACPECTGLGEKMEFDADLIIPDKNLSFNEGAIQWYNPESAWNRARFESLAEYLGFSLDEPIDDYVEPAVEQAMVKKYKR